MVTKSLALVAVGTAAILLSTSVFATRAPISDEVMDGVYGNANAYSVSGGSASSVSLSGGANANVQYSGFQWADNHAGDSSVRKNANDQSGDASQVQQNLSGKANALVVGAVSQDVVSNSGGDIAGSQIATSYAVFTSGGF